MLRLAEFAERLLKISAILGAFGYMSLRAHLNYLGISSTSSLGLERYLMETYHIVATIFLPLILIILCFGVGFVLLYPIAIFLKRISRIKRILKTAKSYAAKRYDTPFVPGLLIAALLFVYVWMFRVLSRGGSAIDVAVGNLDASNLQHVRAEDFFYFVCIVCATGYFLYSRFHTSSESGGRALTRYLWKIFAAALIVLAVQLPLLYGRFVRSTFYPSAQIVLESGGSKTICGLVILDTPFGLTLWRAEDGIGKVISVPHSQIRAISTGRLVDLLEAANQHASNRGCPAPKCPEPPSLQSLPPQPSPTPNKET